MGLGAAWMAQLAWCRRVLRRAAPARSRIRVRVRPADLCVQVLRQRHQLAPVEREELGSYLERLFSHVEDRRGFAAAPARAGGRRRARQRTQPRSVAGACTRPPRTAAAARGARSDAIPAVVRSAAACAIFALHAPRRVRPAVCVAEVASVSQALTRAR